MLKLTTGEKIKFFMKEGVCFKEQQSTQTSMQYNFVQFTVKISTKNFKKRGCWIAENISTEKGEEIKYTHISTDNVLCYSRGNGVYLIGTEGIFYKKNKKTAFDLILPGYLYEGCKCYPNIQGLVILFSENGDKVYSFEGKEIEKLFECEEIKTIKSFDSYEVQRDEIVCCRDYKIQMMTKENGKYYHYYIDSVDIYYDNISFDHEDDIQKLQEGQLVLAFDEATQKNVIVSMDSSKVKVHSDFFDELIELDEAEHKQNESKVKYYMAKNTKTRTANILRYANILEKGLYKNLGMVPYNDIEFLKKENNQIYYIIRQVSGAYLIKIGENSLESHYYSDLEKLLSECK